MKRIETFLILSLLAVVFLTSCGNDNEPSKFSDVTLVAGSTKTLKDGANFKWTSENDYIATLENGTIEAKRVGSVKMACSEGSFKVTVTPQYNYYSEPYIQFGASKSDVKGAMKGSELVKETEDMLLYAGTEYTTYVCYSFKDSKLNSSSIYTQSKYVQECANWAKERYVIMAAGDNYIGLATVDMKTLIVLMPTKLNNKYYYLMMYSANTSNS